MMCVRSRQQRVRKFDNDILLMCARGMARARIVSKTSGIERRARVRITRIWFRAVAGDVVSLSGNSRNHCLSIRYSMSSAKIVWHAMMALRYCRAP